MSHLPDNRKPLIAMCAICPRTVWDSDLDDCLTCGIKDVCPTCMETHDCEPAVA